MNPDAVFFIRGDSNVNRKNHNRVALLDQLLRDFSLNRVSIQHSTYHHFVGGGQFDSDKDVLLQSSKAGENEKVEKIICKKENPLVLSHHDIILSKFSLAARKSPPKSQQLGKAPRIAKKRERVVWSPQGIHEYQELVGPQLRNLREAWLDPSSTVSMSVTLQLTNFLLTKAASTTTTNW